MDEHISFSVSRVDTFPDHVPRTDERSGFTYQDKYVINYDYSEIGMRIGQLNHKLEETDISNRP